MQLGDKTTETAGNRSLGAIPKIKGTTEQKTGVTPVRPVDEQMQNRVWELERQVERLRGLLIANVIQHGNAETGE